MDALLGLFGYGPLESLLADPEVTDILVDGPEVVRVERAGAIEDTETRFADSDQLLAVARRLILKAGARVDYQRPIADGVLPTGERIHVVLPPIAPDGPLISVRRHMSIPPTLEQLVERAMLSLDEADGLRRAVHDRACVAISGATGTGKTTLLRSLVALAENDRTVVIEETPEIGKPHARVVNLTARAANLEGKGVVSLAELVHASLRMRPDRIVIGEVRGIEAAAALWAMTTGHRGSMLTLHAPDAGSVTSTLARLAASDGCSAADFRAHIDLVVHLERVHGLRKVAAIEEL